MRALRARPVFAFLAISIAAFATPLGAGASSPPNWQAPIADLTLQAGSTIVGAVDLAAHFSVADATVLQFRGVEPPGGSPDDGRGPSLAFRGTWVDVYASSTSWNGSRHFMVEACVGAGADLSCSYSNSFQVTVLPAPFGRPDLNPPGFQIVEVPASAAPTSGQSFEAQVDASTGSEIRSTPEWYLDNQLLQQGSTVNVSGLSPGRHKLEARFDSADGPVIVVREFDARLAPGSGFPWTSALLASLAGGAVGAAIVVGSSSRLRRPLVILLFASVYARLNRESLLDHFNRGSLHGIIKENPGIHFSDLRRRAGLSNGSAIHHLRALEQGGYIRVTSAGAFTRYFAMGQPVDAETYGLSPADSAVLRAVLNTPGIALADLAKGMGRSLGTTSRAVTRLSSLGFVSTERARRKRLVYPRQGGGTLPEAGTPGPSISED